MELSNSTIAPSRHLQGLEQDIAIAAGEKIRIRVVNEDLLNETCPAGKKWVAVVSVDIKETDA